MWTAQREYASQDRLGDGVLAYAQFLRSTPGTHDGLFWPAKPGEELSPLGPLVAQARVEGYHRTAKMLNDEQAPYHGYYFKILTRQGKHAPGGKYDYIINGRMIAGFALVAWPAEWGNTGVMTFIVNQQGKVYQKNLGPKTAKIARAMTTYDPDDTWTPARRKLEAPRPSYSGLEPSSRIEPIALQKKAPYEEIVHHRFDDVDRHVVVHRLPGFGPAAAPGTMPSTRTPASASS